MQMKFKRVLWPGLLVLILGVLVILPGCQGQNDQQAKTDQLIKVRMATAPVPHLSLLNVAIKKDFFQDEGLDVEVKEFTSGKLALQALIGGSLDISFSAERPVMSAVLNGEQVYVLTKLNEMRGGFPMVLRKEGDAFKAAEYFSKKRKIATLVGGGPEYFTAEFFAKHNIQAAQYELVSMSPPDMPTALMNEDVDGVAIFEPFAHFAVVRTGQDNVWVIKDADLYSEIMVLLAMPGWAQENQDTIVKFLKALKKAEEFIKQNRREAISIASGVTKLSQEDLEKVWDDLRFDLGLNKEIIQVMNKEAKWSRETGKVSRDTQLPDYSQIILEGPLKQVVPERVEL